MGTHQKIDRISRRHLSKLLSDDTIFPSARRIIQFEGLNGPDGIKVKSPAKDEPWHYMNPFDDTDTVLSTLIEEHYTNLVLELKSGKNQERIAFEAAWLAHALVDGLTPAHHYPYEQKLSELRKGKDKESRTTYREKLLMHGDTRREKAKNNWKMWGAKGLFTTHTMFEFGVATLLKPLALSEAVPTEADLARVEREGVIGLFRQTAREIAVLDMYTTYYKKGWTPKLAWQVRHRLGPAIVQVVTLAWYAALKDANKL